MRIRTFIKLLFLTCLLVPVSGFAIGEPYTSSDTSAGSTVGAAGGR